MVKTESVNHAYFVFIYNCLIWDFNKNAVYAIFIENVICWSINILVSSKLYDSIFKEA